MDILREIKRLKESSIKDCLTVYFKVELEEIQVPLLQINPLITNQRITNHSKDNFDEKAVEKIQKTSQPNTANKKSLKHFHVSRLLSFITQKLPDGKNLEKSIDKRPKQKSLQIQRLEDFYAKW